MVKTASNPDDLHAGARHFSRNLFRLTTGYGKRKAIADKAGIARANLSRIIHGKSIPALDVALGIADAVGVDIATLTRETV